ncbi:MAG TPA: aldehyde dehydrogenase family protein, partial [Pyrinomonadaceae bacterium]|nr:aldehyde dehydrogenase family protein [Pyrinomonadaceae bacterium]
MQTQRVLDEFRNEPFTDFSVAENASAYRDAVAAVRQELGREYQILIDGERITLSEKFESYNPSNKTEVVGVFSEVDVDAEALVNRAIEAASEAFKTWRNVPAAERADYLF